MQHERKIPEGYILVSEYYNSYLEGRGRYIPRIVDIKELSCVAQPVSVGFVRLQFYEGTEMLVKETFEEIMELIKEGKGEK